MIKANKKKKLIHWHIVLVFSAILITEEMPWINHGISTRYWNGFRAVPFSKYSSLHNLHS